VPAKFRADELGLEVSDDTFAVPEDAVVQSRPIATSKIGNPRRLCAHGG
jgi:hypothetical protein